jgi:hypothetical protein
MSPSSASSLRLLAPSALLLALCACAEIQRDPGVMFASNPSGARVLVDGVDSGFVTPCHIDIPRAAHDIDLVLEGHSPASVHIDATGDTWLILWDEAYVNENTWRSPLWLNARDGLFPVKVERNFEPARIYVNLRLAESRGKSGAAQRPEATPKPSAPRRGGRGQ